jgi:hypothetical protein
MKKQILLLLCLFIAGFSQAQTLASSVVGAGGGQFSSTSGFLDWTLGEIMTETYQKGNFYFTQGFQQPATIKVTGLDETETNVFVYPNPLRDVLNIKTSENGDYLIELFDLQGRQLVNKNVSGVVGTSTHQIDLADYRAALYLLRIHNTTTGKSTYHKIEKL